MRVPLVASLAGARGGAVMITIGVGARLDGSAKPAVRVPLAASL